MKTSRKIKYEDLKPGMFVKQGKHSNVIIIREVILPGTCSVYGLEPAIRFYSAEEIHYGSLSAGAQDYYYLIRINNPESYIKTLIEYRRESLNKALEDINFLESIIIDKCLHDTEIKTNI